MVVCVLSWAHKIYGLLAGMWKQWANCWTFWPIFTTLVLLPIYFVYSLVSIYEIFTRIIGQYPAWQVMSTPLAPGIIHPIIIIMISLYCIMWKHWANCQTFWPIFTTLVLFPIYFVYSLVSIYGIFTRFIRQYPAWLNVSTSLAPGIIHPIIISSYCMNFCEYSKNFIYFS